MGRDRYDGAQGGGYGGGRRGSRSRDGRGGERREVQRRGESRGRGGSKDRGRGGGGRESRGGGGRDGGRRDNGYGYGGSAGYGGGGGGGGRYSGGAAGGGYGGQRRDDRQADRGRDRSRSQRGGGGWSPRRESRDGGRRAEPPPPPPPQAHMGNDGGGAYDKQSTKAAGKKNDGRDAGRRSGSGGSSSSGGGSGSSDQDEIIHFDWKEGQVLNTRYELRKLMGDGTFGRVVSARDIRNDHEVAIKIIRDVKRYMENAKIEADILKDIAKADPEGKSGCAIMYETFVHDTRFYCLVFEPLGTSLYDFVKANDFRGCWMQDIQRIAEQSLRALGFMHDRMQLTHTDLKPENVLLVTRQRPSPTDFPREAAWLRARGAPATHTTSPYLRPATSDIKLIDFGNATYASEHHSSIINTRQYRGPEVLLELGWNELSDMWSIGCILMELYTGEQLMGTHEELEHLALIERIIGRLPTAMLDAAAKDVKERYLSKSSHTGHYRLPWPEKAASSSSERHVAAARPLLDQVPRAHEAFGDFLQSTLALDPKRRPGATQGLKHRFFSVRYED